jgi:uroporphyrinogen-III synthase
VPIPIYRAKPVDDVQLPDADIALIHSPRAGARFAKLAQDKSCTTIVAISQPAADAAGDGWRGVEVAEQLTDEALLALAARLCNKPRP